MVRIKHRYLLFNILYPDNTSFKVATDTPEFLRIHAPTPRHVTSQVLIGHLRSQIASSFGDQGLGLCLSSLKIIYFSNATSTAILRVPRSCYQIVWATLSYMTELPVPRSRDAVPLKCVVRVVRVSGTIRKAEEELLRRSRSQIVKAKLSGVDVQEAMLSRLTGGDASNFAPPEDNDDPMFEEEESRIESDSE